MDATTIEAGDVRREESYEGEIMCPWESRLVREAIDGICQVFDRHKGGVFDAVALREVDRHASAVRIYTTDAFCRERFTYIQEQAALYFSSGKHEGVRPRIEKALGALRARVRAA